MKTQIKSLKRGDANSVGSSQKERMAIAEKVMAENEDILKVEVLDLKLDLSPIRNYNGKAIAFKSRQLSSKEVAKVLPHDYKAIEHPELVEVRFFIYQDMRCEWATFRRTRVNRQWKEGQSIPVDAGEVTIL